MTPAEAPDRRTAPGAPAVQVRQVSKTFGVNRVLTDVSVDVAAGSSTALLGRNGAGKSTLISIITGVLRPDSGSVEFGGAVGGEGAVGCVYQKSTLVPQLTAAENILLNAYPRRGPFRTVDWGAMRRSGREVLDEWECGHVADQLVEELEPVERKIVEICRVLATAPSLLLLDEPTAGLDFAGTRRLFDHIGRARRRGVSLLYVSHHLDEIFDVCDRMAVLRDGRVSTEGSLEGKSVRDLVAAMVGGDQAHDRPQPLPAVDVEAPVALTVRGMSLRDRLEDVDLDVRAGECVGVTGLDGSGHVQLAEVLCGLTRPDGGQIAVKGVPLTRSGVEASLAAGIGSTPEDRHDGGYVPAMSVAENATMPRLYRMKTRAGTVRAHERDERYGGLARQWNVKATDPGQPVEELSGGNQQKVVLARAVSSEPEVLVLANPTAGVDVAAKRSIYETITAHAAGKGVLVVSSDDEDLALCQRVLVMYRGRVHRELLAPFSTHDLTLAIQGE